MSDIGEHVFDGQPDDFIPATLSKGEHVVNFTGVSSETLDLLNGGTKPTGHSVQVDNTLPNGTKTTFILYRVQFEPIKFNYPKYRWWQFIKRRRQREALRNGITVRYTGKVA